MGRHGRRQKGRDLCLRARGAQGVALIKEVDGLKQIVEDMKETVTGLRVEYKGTETGSRVTTIGVNQDGEEAVGNIRIEEIITGVEEDGEIRTEERKEICSGTSLMATGFEDGGISQLETIAKGIR